MVSVALSDDLSLSESALSPTFPLLPPHTTTACMASWKLTELIAVAVQP